MARLCDLGNQAYDLTASVVSHQFGGEHLPDYDNVVDRLTNVQKEEDGICDTLRDAGVARWERELCDPRFYPRRIGIPVADRVQQVYTDNHPDWVRCGADRDHVYYRRVHLGTLPVLCLPGVYLYDPHKNAFVVCADSLDSPDE